MMAGRHCSGASVGLLLLIASCQVIEPKSLEFNPIDRLSRAQNQQANKTAASVDQIAAILSAKPRSTKLQTQKFAAQSSAEPLQPELPLVQSSEIKRKSNKTQPNKRQTDLLDHSNGWRSGTRSRRNEDPWFLDQAPLPLQPYRFGYNVKGNNGLTQQYRQEAGDGKFLTGSYGYVLPDGIYRHVDYVADDRGFRASIRTSEPGTANENPADVVINSNSFSQQSGLASTSGSSLPSPAGVGFGGFSNATSSWNYSGTPQGYAPIDISRTSDGVSLARRPAGSIINTPLRNFNSFSYAQPPSQLPTLPSFSLNNSSALPSTQFEPLPPLLESTRASSSPSNELKLTQFQSTTSWPSNSWSDRKPANNEQTLNRFAPSRSFELPSRPTQGSFFAGAFDQTGTSLASNFAHSIRDQSQLHNRNGPSTVARIESKLVSPTRTGPNLLHYDQPFVSYQRENPRKIHYDSSYVFHPRDSPFLSLERAKSISQLDRFNSVIRELNYQRPTGLLGSDEIRQPTSSTSPASGLSSGSHFEQNHELNSSRQFADLTGKLSATKEHSNSGSSTMFGQTSARLDANLGGNNALLPPRPQFQSALSSQGQASLESGVKGQPRGRLMAPYAGNLDQQQEQQLQEQFSGVKGGQTSGHTESQSMQNTQETIEPMAKTSPRPAEETSAERPQSANELDKALGATNSPSDSDSDSEQQIDEIELSRMTTKSVSQDSKSKQTRKVHLPEEYLSKMLINDVRSMQNSIGLPQPPRFQRSSFLASPDELSLPLGRVEPADGRLFNRFEGAQLKHNQVVDERPRQLNSGRLDRAANYEEPPQLASNETFEALRLSANNAQNLRSEKLSELEKFQQRLRNQQKLLESIKSPIESAVKQNAASVSRPTSETANSHVKYDEPNDSDSHKNAPAKQVQRSPKSPDGQNQTLTLANRSPVDKLLHIHKLALNGARSGDKEAHENEIKSDVEVKETQPKSPNTINLDFINSVTALSVDHSNPFAISSVNPAVQRSSERLSFHKLTLPVVANSTSNSTISPARPLFSPPDSFSASIEHQDKGSTTGSLGSTLRIDATGSSSLLQNNHRNANSDQLQVGPAHLLHEAANSQHKSFMTTRNSDTNRDGFEIRDRAIEADNRQFFEVVAN